MTDPVDFISINEVTNSVAKNFSCNVPQLDLYIQQRFAKKNQKNNVSPCRIAVPKESTNGPIIGYFTLSMSSVDSNDSTLQQFQLLPNILQHPERQWSSQVNEVHDINFLREFQFQKSAVQGVTGTFTLSLV